MYDIVIIYFHVKCDSLVCKKNIHYNRLKTKGKISTIIKHFLTLLTPRLANMGLSREVLAGLSN
jgi:hypothetical protein